MTIKTEVTDRPDWDALAAIHNDAFERSWDAAAIRELLAIAGTMAFIAFPSPDPCPKQEGDARTLPPLAGGAGGGNTLGFGLLRHFGQEAEILTLAVPPTQTRRGIGTAIVRAMRQWAEEKGAKAVFLEVSEHNAAAIRLYEDNGFCVFSRRKEYYRRADGSHEHALVMRCTVTNI